MAAHVELLKCVPGKEKEAREGCKNILRYYKDKYPQANKTIFKPLEGDEWMIVETYETREILDECRAEKIADPEFHAVLATTGADSVVPKSLTHKFYEVFR